MAKQRGRSKRRAGSRKGHRPTPQPTRKARPASPADSATQQQPAAEPAQRSAEPPGRQQQATKAAEPNDKFWEFWRLADQAHDLRQRTRTVSIAPLVGGLVVLCLVGLAISGGLTATPDTETHGSRGPSTVTTHPDGTAVEDVDVSTADQAGVKTEAELDRKGDTETEPGSGNNAADSGSQTSADKSSDDPQQSKSGEQAASDPVPISHASPTDTQPATDHSPVTEADPEDTPPSQPAPEDPGPADPAPADSTPEDPDPTDPALTEPASLPEGDDAAAVSISCVLGQVGNVTMGCIQGTTQLLELVDVVTDETGSVALWCLPEITDEGGAGCGGGSTYFLERMTTAQVVGPSGAAATDSLAGDAPPASPDPVETGWHTDEMADSHETDGPGDHASSDHASSDHASSDHASSDHASSDHCDGKQHRWDGTSELAS